MKNLTRAFNGMMALGAQRALVALAITAAAAISCTKDNPDTPEPMDETINIIFDTDLGNCTDDVFAMQALFSYQNEGKCKVVGVMQNLRCDKAKDLTDRFLHFYKADDVPYGVVEGDEPYFVIVPYCELVDSLKLNGEPLFEPTGIPLKDRMPAWKLYRKLLSEAADNSITIVCTGIFTNLGLLLDSCADEYSDLSGTELVRKKVKSLHLTGGCFSPLPLRYQGPDEPAKFLEIEYNIAGDVPLAKRVIEGWPGALFMFPVEEGISFPSIHDRILYQYEWQPDSPIYQIYDRYDEWACGDVGQYLWDALTMLHAILGEDNFQCSPQGYINISDEGLTSFSYDDNGKDHIISANALGVAALWEAFNSLAEFRP